MFIINHNTRNGAKVQKVTACIEAIDHCTDTIHMLLAMLICTIYTLYRYSEEHKLPSSLEKREYNDLIKDAEEEMIRAGDYDIGKL